LTRSAFDLILKERPDSVADDPDRVDFLSFLHWNRKYGGQIQ